MRCEGNWKWLNVTNETHSLADGDCGGQCFSLTAWLADGDYEGQCFPLSALLTDGDYGGQCFPLSALLTDGDYGGQCFPLSLLFYFLETLFPVSARPQLSSVTEVAAWLSVTTFVWGEWLHSWRGEAAVQGKISRGRSVGVPSMASVECRSSCQVA